MKCLKIDNGKGEYSVDGTIFAPIDSITKEDVLKLLDIALDNKQDFEMDEYISDSFTNPAHRVIYSNLHDKFVLLKASKSQFTTEVSELYQEAFDKYKLDDSEDSVT